VEPTPAEIRVLGCLIEKQRTTPDAYPLSLNGLRLACNQSTNRDPVMDLDDAELREALERLHRRGWTRLASGAGSRAAKHRHLLDRELSLAAPELSVLAVLMLRGPQTSSELHARSERLHRFASAAEVERALCRLADRELAELTPRQAGQRGQRWRQLLGDEASEARGAPPPEGPPDAHPESLEQRVAALEREVAALREALGS